LSLNTGHLASADQPGWNLIEDLPAAVVSVAYKDHTPSQDEPYFKSLRLDRGTTPNYEYVRRLRHSGLDVYQFLGIEDEAWEDKGMALYTSRRYIEDLWQRAGSEEDPTQSSVPPAATVGGGG
jgi:hypothetical protein